MDYTTLARVKQEADIAGTTDDALLSLLITSASRWLDRELTGVAIGSDNYLLSETVTNETLFGQVDADGSIHVWTHKPTIAAITAMSWRPDPMTNYMDVTVLDEVWNDRNHVIAFNATRNRGKVQVKISYTGGLASATASLPADILEDVAVMVIRVYRENKTGLTDSMGVAELGTATYTKAVPVRLQEWIQSYKRVVPW
jgi:hypothetical protein